MASEIRELQVEPVAGMLRIVAPNEKHYVNTENIELASDGCDEFVIRLTSGKEIKVEDDESKTTLREYLEQVWDVSIDGEVD